jgi:hypothetical protein
MKGTTQSAEAHAEGCKKRRVTAKRRPPSREQWGGGALNPKHMSPAWHLLAPTLNRGSPSRGGASALEDTQSRDRRVHGE